MKKLIMCFLICLFSNLASAQFKSPFWEVFPIVDSSIVYTEVVQVDSTIGADLLYKNAKLWIVDNYKSAKDVIQNEDDKSLIIIGKGFFELGHIPSVNLPKQWQTIKIECKPGRYKYTIYNFRYTFTVDTRAVSAYGSITDYDKTLIEWGGSDLKKEKSIQPLKDFAIQIDTNIKLMIQSLKKRMIKIDENW